MTLDDLRDALAPASDGGRGPLLNRSQVAALLGVDQASVLRRYERGTLPEPVARDAGGRPLWLPEQYEQEAQ